MNKEMYGEEDSVILSMSVVKAYLHDVTKIATMGVQEHITAEAHQVVKRCKTGSFLVERLKLVG